MIRSLTIAVALLLAGCSGRGPVVEGTVCDVTQNTVTLCTPTGDTITFRTAEAVRDCAGGVHRGSPVTVVCDGEPCAGFGTATKVIAPAEYNLLIGIWMRPGPADADKNEGFALWPCGEAESINVPELCIDGWSTEGGMLTLTGRSLGIGISTGYSETAIIERLDGECLMLRFGEQVQTYHRSEYPQ